MNIVTVLSGKPPTLAEAQRLVGGYVELVLLADGSQMLVDEEGLIKELEANTAASLMANQLIVGPALILQGTARWTDTEPFISDAELDAQFEQYVQEKEKDNMSAAEAHELVDANVNQVARHWLEEKGSVQPEDYADHTHEDLGVFLRPQAD